MKLITELTEEVSYVTEEVGGAKHHFIEGVFLQANKANRNGRLYPTAVMEAAVQKYMDTHVKTNRAYGELGHPAGPQINLDRVSHMIVKLEQSGDNYIGKARLTETPMGNIARGLLSSGANLGVSSRGLGTLKPQRGLMEVQSDFRLATAADIVADPSAPDAFVRGVMEGAEWLYDDIKDTWVQQNVHEMRVEGRKMTKRQLEEQKLAMFSKFMRTLSGNN